MSTSFFKRFGEKTVRLSTGIANPAGEVARQAGLGTNNTARQLGDITGVTAERTQDAYNQGGLGAVKDLAKSGDLTDPAGILHPLGPGPAAPAAPPSSGNIEPAALNARDRIRRLVYRSQGRNSTIKVSPTATAYTGQPKALLGS